MDNQVEKKYRGRRQNDAGTSKTPSGGTAKGQIPLGTSHRGLKEGKPENRVQMFGQPGSSQKVSEGRESIGFFAHDWLTGE